MSCHVHSLFIFRDMEPFLDNDEKLTLLVVLVELVRGKGEEQTGSDGSAPPGE